MRLMRAKNPYFPILLVLLSDRLQGSLWRVMAEGHDD